MRVAREQTRGNHCAWVRRIGAARDRRDHHGAVVERVAGSWAFRSDAVRLQLRGRNVLMWVLGAGDGARDGVEIELERAIVLDVRERVAPEPLRLRVCF